MDENSKTQLIESIKKAQNILVTVSKNPSVDQLAACISLTLMLNKLDKHATAVFSGRVPSTIEFLKPEETLEQNTDSLRDFIISLDKSKADKLRYKVEDDVVRIYITPYRTSLSQQDLVFSEGDFNVDVIIALNVSNQDDLDDAIIAHGRILHDATVYGVAAGQQVTEIGSVNVIDPNASSLCEMIVGMSESLKPSLIDNQIATALLTGIVAETDRFRNEKTTPKAMTMSAQLMSIGANQQLIADELTKDLEQSEEETMVVDEASDESGDNNDGEDVDDEGTISLHHELDGKEKSPKEGDIGDENIHIDNEGDFSNAEDLREGRHQKKAKKLYKLAQHEKVIAPIAGGQGMPAVDLEELAKKAEREEQENDNKDDNGSDNPDGHSTEEQDEQYDNNDIPSLPTLPGVPIQPGDEPSVPDDADDEELVLPPREQEFTEHPQISQRKYQRISPDQNDDQAREEESPFPIASDEDELPSIEQGASQYDDNRYSKYLNDDEPHSDNPLNSTSQGSASRYDNVADLPLAYESQEEPYRGAESLLATNDDAESPRAPETPETRHNSLLDDGESRPSGVQPFDLTTMPLGPNVQPNETLSQIENDVKRFADTSKAVASEDDARLAVGEAIQSNEQPVMRNPEDVIREQVAYNDTIPQDSLQADATVQPNEDAGGAQYLPLNEQGPTWQVSSDIPSNEDTSFDTQSPPPLPPPLPPFQPQ